MRILPGVRIQPYPFQIGVSLLFNLFPGQFVGARTAAKADNKNKEDE